MTRLPVRTSKYGNHSFTLNGEKWDSKAEYYRWQELNLLQKAGEIKDLRRQVPYEIIPKTDRFRKAEYIADFVYTDVKTGKEIVEDAKGVETDVFILKKKLMYYVHGIEIQLIKR